MTGLILATNSSAVLKGAGLGAKIGPQYDSGLMKYCPGYLAPGNKLCLIQTVTISFDAGTRSIFLLVERLRSWGFVG
jgi:hypothetical protein